MKIFIYLFGIASSMCDGVTCCVLYIYGMIWREVDGRRDVDAVGRVLCLHVEMGERFFLLDVFGRRE